MALCPDDTSEVLLIEGDVLLNDENDTKVTALLFLQPAGLGAVTG